MSAESVVLTTDSPEETRRMAAAFAPLCRPNDVIGLQGTLGAGKTCFVKGLAVGLGVPDDRAVISPTFVLQRSYEGRLRLHHFDAYRLGGAAELEEIGCAETFESGGVSVVEWADRVTGCLPAEHFMLSIVVTGPRRRRFELAGRGAGPRARVPEFRVALTEWTP